MDILHLCEKTGNEMTPTVLALGFFDGLHIGHAALFEKAVQEARARGIPAAVFTFADSPSLKGGLHLYPEEERLSRFADFGIDRVYLADFPALSSLSPDAFVCDVLLKKLRVAAVVCGFNYRFGSRAAGDADRLAALLAPHGVPVFALPAKMQDKTVVSTSAIKEALSYGDPRTAAAMLGRPYSLSGHVAHGKALGRRIGIPTANLPFPDGIFAPRRGVYAVSCTLPQTGIRLLGLANVGVRPTVEDADRENCEVHFFSEVGELYGQAMTVEFLEFIRPEERFADLAALRARIAQDKVIAKEYFEKWNGQN